MFSQVLLSTSIQEARLRSQFTDPPPRTAEKLRRARSTAFFKVLRW